MARVKAIIFDERAMTPCGSGWKVDGIFFGTWIAAATYLLGGEAPTEEQVLNQEEAEISRGLDRMEDTNHCIAERRVRNV